VEKTSAELFSDEVEMGKEIVDAQDRLAEVKRIILNKRKQIDDLRKSIRSDEEQVMDWEKVIRSKRQLKTEKHTQAWAARHSGI